jgi:hypothetical protein
MKIVRLLALLSVCLAAGARAEGHEPEPVAIAPQPQSVDGYRLQIVAADVASVALLLGAGAAEGTDGGDTWLSETLAVMGGSTFGLGAPAVHASHGNWGRAGISLGLRFALPLAGGLIGGSLADCEPDAFLCGLSEFAGGFFAGAATASLLDVVLLAGGDVEHAPAPRAGVSVRPRLMASPSAASVGVTGSF